jgi:hypothetical protein
MPDGRICPAASLPEPGFAQFVDPGRAPARPGSGGVLGDLSLARPGGAGGHVLGSAGAAPHPRADLRDRKLGAELGDQHRRRRLGIVAASVAPAEHADLGRQQIPQLGGPLAAISRFMRPMARRPRSVCWKENITGTFQANNSSQLNSARGGAVFRRSRARPAGWCCSSVASARRTG